MLKFLKKFKKSMEHFQIIYGIFLIIKLYMKITKSIYDNNMDENSVMCMINPTGLVDNNSVGKYLLFIT